MGARAIRQSCRLDEDRSPSTKSLIVPTKPTREVLVDPGPQRIFMVTSHLLFDGYASAFSSPEGRVAPRRTRETPEFQRENREFAAAVETAGKPVRLPPRSQVRTRLAAGGLE